MLDDASIRLALKDFIVSKRNKPRLLIEELRIHDGNAIADVVAIYDFMHAYEIKGEGDNVSRLKIQSTFYNASFPTVTLVTTQNHLGWAKIKLERFWGIILASETQKGVKFNYIRGAKNNPAFSCKISLSMLWRDELIKIGTQVGHELLKKNDSRAVLAEKISPVINRSEAASMLSQSIFERYSQTI